MGGNAIKNARRIDKQEFLEICHELQNIFPELKMKPTRSFFDKESFGDIDVVVEKHPTINIKNLVRSRLNNPEEYDNNMFYSFSYHGVQVDFIQHDPEYFVFAWHYYSWNDIHNFVGRVARSLNFKFGHDGLSYELHLDDTTKISVVVSRDYYKSLEFLGYDPIRWSIGFKTKLNIFKAVTETKYFNPLYFTLEDQSHNDRVRNKKRKMYQDMLQYINDNNLQPKPKLTDEERQAEYERARKVFGEKFHTEVESAKAAHEKNNKFKKIFNGDVVSELTGLTGKELGRYMQYLKGVIVEQFVFYDMFITFVLNYGENAEIYIKEYVMGALPFYLNLSRI